MSTTANVAPYGISYTVGAQGATGPGGGGGGGVYTGVTGSSAGNVIFNPGVVGSSSYYATGSIYTTTPAYEADLVLRRNGKDIRVGDAIEMIMNRLCIITPALELIEKYPALKEAYENYKLIETMVMNGDDEDAVG